MMRMTMGYQGFWFRTGDIILADRGSLSSICTRSWVQSPAPHKPGVKVYTCNICTWEPKAGGLRSSMSCLPRFLALDQDTGDLSSTNKEHLEGDEHRPSIQTGKLQA